MNKSKERDQPAGPRLERLRLDVTVFLVSTVSPTSFAQPGIERRCHSSWTGRWALAVPVVEYELSEKRVDPGAQFSFEEPPALRQIHSLLIMRCAGQVWCAVDLVSADVQAIPRELIAECGEVLRRIRYIFTPIH